MEGIKNYLPVTACNITAILEKDVTTENSLFSKSARLKCLEKAVSALVIGVFSALLGLFNIVNTPYVICVNFSNFANLSVNYWSVLDTACTLLLCPIGGVAMCSYHLAAAILYPGISLKTSR